jgi:hypothetical protein
MLLYPKCCVSIHPDFKIECTPVPDSQIYTLGAHPSEQSELSFIPMFMYNDPCDTIMRKG